MHIHPLGDRALIVEIEGGIDTETLDRIRMITSQIDQARIAGVTDIVPGYASVAIHYEPSIAGAAAMRRALGEALQAPATPAAHTDSHTVDIPVVYGGADGPDLDAVARHCGLSPQDVITRHAAATYTVHMIGFVPGFPYLGGLDPRLATPRLQTPRTLVPAGSVGIGGEQTGVYPVASPGGWQLIGRTPLRLFDPSRDAPALLQLGDRVRFIPSGGP